MTCRRFLVLLSCLVVPAALAGAPLRVALPSDRHLAEEERRAETLSRKMRAARECGEARLRVIEDLRAGRLTASEAVERFRQLSRKRNELSSEPGAYRAPEDDEGLRRQVLVWARP